MDTWDGFQMIKFFWNSQNHSVRNKIQQVLRTEVGCMNEVFADLYIITNQSKYLEAAQRLSHQSILKPLLDKEDKLTGLRANTQIPKVIGFEKIAMLTKNAE